MHRHNEFLVTDIPRRSARLYPRKTAIIFKEKRFTYQELFERTNQLAHGLLRLGIQKGDRCAVFAMNNNQYLECFYGIPKSGGIIVPINYRLAGRELVYILNDAGASTLIYEEGYSRIIDEAKSQIPVQSYICIGESKKDEIGYEDLLSGSDRKEPELTPKGLYSEDVTGIFYTSGTTGYPKGAMLTQRNLISNMWGLDSVFQSNQKDIYLTVMPQFHASALQYGSYHLAWGGTVVIIEKFDPEEIFRIIEREKITTTSLVPAMVIALIEHPAVKEYDLSSLRRVLYGASPMPIEKIKKAIEILQCGFFQSYGMTELGPHAVSRLLPNDHLLKDDDVFKERRLASAGVCCPTVEIKIVDDFDQEITKPGKVGEVCVRGEPVMKGYWGKPQETAEALKGGWFHTGDLGYLDDGGYLYLVDRKKDMIISGGENIYCAEVENVISNHPDVLECSVFGVPDQRWGEAVHALIVLKPGVSCTVDKIIDYCKQNMASYKKPKSVEFVKCIPRNPMGKIAKYQLKQKYWEGIA